MPTGTVKWFNNTKGYGFILSQEASEDLFAHFSEIEMEGYKTLKAGQSVSFDIERADKGYHAKRIAIRDEVKSVKSSTTEAMLVATG